MKIYKGCCRKGVLSLLLTIVFGTIIVGIPIVGGVEPAGIAVYVDPPMVWDPEMPIGTEFTVDICVKDVSNLWAFQFWLSFDPTVIQGVPTDEIDPDTGLPYPVECGEFLGRDTDPRFHPVKVAAGEGWDNEVGQLKIYGAFIVFEVTPPHDRYLADGSGVLATATFVKVGDGCSPIILGAPETGLSNKYAKHDLRNYVTGVYEYCYGLIQIFPPGKPPYWDDYWPWLWVLGNCSGYFSNQEGPELYIRRRGAHGSSGIWPEWAAGIPYMTQTLYCRIMNYGFMGAWVEVEFVIRSELDGIRIMSDQVWIDPAIAKGEPSHVTVSVSLVPTVIGKYWIYGVLYFQVGCMTAKKPYYEVEDILGGEGISRDIAVGFNVKENM